MLRTRRHEPQTLRGDRKVDVLYSDNSGEINKALRDCAILPQNSLPGEPRNNSVVERVNGDILEGARTNLVRAGTTDGVLAIRGDALLHHGERVR